VRDKKVRLPRIERDEQVLLREDENAHLWAVSYADFLMALLSFFILFYSSDPKNKKHLIINLASQFSNNGGSTKGWGGSAGDGDAKTIAERLPATFMNAFKDLDVKMDQNDETLIANFSNDFFEPGQHIISPDQKKQILTFLERIKPYGEKVNLVFEGHTDDKPLTKHRNSIVVDNFVLSSLRASSALLVAKQMGFSEKNLFIQADSSNTRNSRSLSIRIESHKEML
jgi:flagellar motor protein MotB